MNTNYLMMMKYKNLFLAVIILIKVSFPPLNPTMFYKVVHGLFNEKLKRKRDPLQQ
jgi:hypothetical protein